ncbi:MAG: hypothetical protein Q9217_002766 [Psora testacea]
MTISNDSKFQPEGPMMKDLKDTSVSKDSNAWIDGSLIQELKDKLRGSTVLTPDSEGYAESIKRWSDAVEKRAGIVVYVRSAEDISTCILFCRQNSVDFVVCGGKHSSSGASSSEGGLVIDLGHMRGVKVDPETKTLRVQGGCIWKDVDEAAAPYGLAMVGGTVNHTGVGGLTLGGGYGWLSGRHGLTIDGLLEVEIILADGSIKRASKTEYPDLFWAICGAGHSFGAVSEFVFQAHEQANEIWAGQIVFDPAENLEAIVSFANHLAIVTDGDSGMAMALGPPPFLPGPGIVTTLFYNGPQSKAEELFKPLLDLPAIKKDYGMRPYATMNSILNFAVEYGGRKCTKGASAITPLSPLFIQNLLQDLSLFHRKVPNCRRSMINIEIFSPEKWCSVPRDATSFFNRGRYQNVVIGPYWEDPAYDGESREWARNIARKFRLEIDWRKEFFGDKMADQDIREYGNYDGKLEPYIQSSISVLNTGCETGTGASSHVIFGSNYDRLVEIKAKYDPADTFNKDYAFKSAAKAAIPAPEELSKPAAENVQFRGQSILASVTGAASPMSTVTLQPIGIVR